MQACPNVWPSCVRPGPYLSPTCARPSLNGERIFRTFHRLADIPHATYAKCEELLSQFYLAVDQRFKAQKFGSNSAVWRAFLSDDFLRLLIYRFVFCCTVLRLCKHSGQKVWGCAACFLFLTS